MSLIRPESSEGNSTNASTSPATGRTLTDRLTGAVRGMVNSWQATENERGDLINQMPDEVREATLIHDAINFNNFNR